MDLPETPGPGAGSTEKSLGDERATGVVGNERLTALAGAVLLVLAAAELITVPALHPLVAVHFFIGVVLVGPLAVKTASTGWRFARYYTRDPAYRLKGPPRPLQRWLAPVLLTSTVVVVGSGIALAIAGPPASTLTKVHVLSFLVWLVTLVVHLVAYIRPVPGLIAAEWRRAAQPATVSGVGRAMRSAVNLVALAASAIAGVAVLPMASAWSGTLAAGELPLGLSVIALIVILTGLSAFVFGGAQR